MDGVKRKTDVSTLLSESTIATKVLVVSKMSSQFWSTFNHRNHPSFKSAIYSLVFLNLTIVDVDKYTHLWKMLKENAKTFANSTGCTPLGMRSSRSKAKSNLSRNKSLNTKINKFSTK